MSDVTRILSQIESGDPSASEKLLPLVYEELRQLAASRLAREKPGQTLQATALVHEAYVRLVDDEKARNWNSRAHFFGAAAEAMRRILVESARSKARIKRGGSLRRTVLQSEELGDGPPDVDVLAIDDALSKFTTTHPEKAELVKLRYFAGLTVAETADVLGISTATAVRNWQFARAWLARELTP